jgi:predicted MFS family arabinose efflux permease
MVLAFVFSLSWGYRWPTWIIWVLGAAVIAMIAFLHRIPQLAMKNPEQRDHFLVPLVPLIPCLATLSTFALCSGIPPKIWGYFAAFELIGACFYFFYGINNSHVGIKQAKTIAARSEIEMRQ